MDELIHNEMHLQSRGGKAAVAQWFLNKQHSLGKKSYLAFPDLDKATEKWQVPVINKASSTR